MTDEQLVSGTGVRRDYTVDGVPTTALSAEAFDVGAGDLIALTGPSGSGKTTLLHLMAGLDVPTAGAVGWPALGPRGSLRPFKVALAFQGPSLLPALTVAENVALPLLIGGMSEAEVAEAVERFLDCLDVSDLAAHLPEELSGGQSQRVGLARALVVQPRLLLADEPTGQQDSAHAAELLGILLEEARASGMALVVATHDPDVAGRLSRRWSLADGVLTTDLVTA